MTAPAGDQRQNDGDKDKGTEAGTEQQEQKTVAPPANETPEEKIARLEANIARRDSENGRARISAKETAVREERVKIAKALAKEMGIELPGEEPSVEELSAKLTAAQKRADQREAELAVYKAAGKHGADADKLLDKRSFWQKIESGELRHDDAAGIDAAVKAAVSSDPSLGTARAAGRTSVEHPGGTGANRDATEKAAPGVDRMRAAYAEAAGN